MKNRANVHKHTYPVLPGVAGQDVSKPNNLINHKTLLVPIFRKNAKNIISKKTFIETVKLENVH